jgi:UDP-N-acetylglucosamine acyltransferase
MKRRGYSKSLIHCLRHAYRIVYRQGLALDDAIEQLNRLEPSPELTLFVSSLVSSTRGITR